MDCVNMGINTSNCVKLRYCIGVVEVHTPRWIVQSVKTPPRIPYQPLNPDPVGITYNIELHNFNDLLSGSKGCFVEWGYLSNVVNFRLLEINWVCCCIGHSICGQG